jgi:hypothetical protein
VAASDRDQGDEKQNRNDNAGNLSQGAISFGGFEKATLQEPYILGLFIVAASGDQTGREAVHTWTAQQLLD